MSTALCAQGVRAVLVDQPEPHRGPASIWLETHHARGWIVAAHSLDTSAWLDAWQAELAAGHVPADAALLAWPELPTLNWGSEVDATPSPAPARHARAAPLGLYAIVDSAVALTRVLDAGVYTAQLRIKRPADADLSWQHQLRRELHEGLAVAEGHDAQLIINDHWLLAAELGARAVHLGQEDLLGLGASGRAELCASGLALGVSSHSVWELCRARGLAPAYIACGPVWPTTTKDMLEATA
ncbi:MAG: Thiamine-phosphate synthase [Pseudomonadota bacterium]|jgi:thiamine-phosphate diphosphorylase